MRARAVLVCIVIAVAGAWSASSSAAPHAFPRSKPVSQMTLREREQFQIRALAHYRGVVRAWIRSRDSHPAVLVELATAPLMPLCRATGVRMPHDVCWYAHAARWTAAELVKTKAAVRAASWPAHHLLWLCIHGTPALGTPVGHEASSWATRSANGHYGGLQMHPGWGYGTSEYASSDSQQVQERAAEAAYKASGYSASFLIGQWGATIGPCWRYAH